MIRQGKSDTLGRTNRDGWGVGYYKKDPFDCIVIKDGPWDYEHDKPKMKKLIDPLYSEIFISHIRRASDKTTLNIKNAHPYQCEKFGRKYLFAHNGKVDRDYIFKHLKEGFIPPKEEKTDSVAYFYLILQKMKKYNMDFIKALGETIEIITESDYSGLNCLLSDGEQLYAFRDYRENNEKSYTLYYLNRNKTDSPFLYVESKQTGATYETKNLDEKAIIIASEKITENKEKWILLKKGEVLIINFSSIKNDLNLYTTII
jgi:glutamine amidotransferase